MKQATVCIWLEKSFLAHPNKFGGYSYCFASVSESDAIGIFVQAIS